MAPKPKRTQKILDDLIDWVGAGKTVASYARSIKVHVATIYAWLHDDPDLARRFARAKDIGYDVISQDVMEIADTPSSHEDDVAHRKLRIHTRMQLLSKWCPAKYGDKLQVGGDPGGVPIELSNVERAARIKALLASVAARKDKNEVSE